MIRLDWVFCSSSSFVVVNVFLLLSQHPGSNKKSKNFYAIINIFVTFPRPIVVLSLLLACSILTSSFLLRTRLKRKYFIRSIEKLSWKRLQWKITIGILLSVKIKKNWVKVLVGDKKFGKKALSGDEISGNFFDRGGIPLIPR